MKVGRKDGTERKKELGQPVRNLILLPLPGATEYALSI
jgi:hypothetical protein